MKKKENKVLQIIKYIIITILVIMLITNIYLIVKSKLHKDKVPSLFGYKVFIVLSDSMETEITTGDIVITKNTDVKDLKVDDIIAYKNSKEYVTTHRIVNIVEEDNNICFETKGDKNNTNDLQVVCSDIIEGKYIKKIPKLGKVLLFLQEPAGLAVLILLLILVCILSYLSTNDKRLISNEEYEEFQEYKKKKNKKD